MFDGPVGMNVSYPREAMTNAFFNGDTESPTRHFYLHQEGAKLIRKFALLKMVPRNQQHTERNLTLVEWMI
jgi:hypothetical protein